MARTHKAAKAKAVKEATHNWIQGMHMKKGALHEQLGIPQGKKIPAAKLAAHKGDSALMRKRKSLAHTLARFRH
jgi:hypothetical protein